MKKSFISLFAAFLSFLVGVVCFNLLSLDTRPLFQYAEHPMIFPPDIPDAAASKPLETLEDEYNGEYKPSPDGAYFPVNKKGLEPETALIVNTYNGISGDIKVGSKLYRYEHVEVTDKHFNFTTFKVKGLQYKFQGRFLQPAFKEFFADGEIVLKGTLQRFHNGKKLSEAETKFTFDSEVCAWMDMEFEYLP